MLRHTIDQMDAWSRAQLVTQSETNNPYFCTPYGQVTYSNIGSVGVTAGTALSKETLDQIYNVFHMEDKTEMNKHETKIDQYGFEKIIQNRSAVIVFWTDKTKTVVKRKEDDCDDIYAAVAQALAKKVYGCNSAFHKMVDRTTEYHITHIETPYKDSLDAFKKMCDDIRNLSRPKRKDKYSKDKD